MPDERAIEDDADAVVIGGGTMGAGIAQVLLDALPHGTVHVVERDAGAAEQAAARVRQGLGLQHKRTDDPDALVRAAMERLAVDVGIERGGSPALVVEAVPEDVEMKKVVLHDASAAWPGSLLATNTSSLSVTELAGAVEPGTAFVGMHFFNPVPRSRLVEIVVPEGCAAEVVGRAREWVARLGKEAIVVGDSPGFATSRLGVALALEAMRMVESGVASAEDIDKGMVLGYSFPVGPLELTDRIGLDVRLAIAEHLAGTLGPRFEPPTILRDKVAAGDLGQKSGQGFYDWSTRR
jgi:3-hydroxybutyryl-CoA dehydrogenase